MKYIGIDYHKRYLVATVMDEKGKIIRKDKVRTEGSTIQRYFREVTNGEEAKAVMEACWNWAYLYDMIEPIIGDVVLAHPYKTRAIAEARIKTDSIDSETLTHLLRADLIAEAYAPSSETRQVKDILRYRAALKQLSTSIKNRVHIILDRNEIEEEEFKALSDKFGKKGKEIMKRMKLKGRDGSILRDYLEILELIEKKIKKIDGWIKEIGKEDKVVQLLKTIPGIGDFIALLLRYEIDDIGRFLSSKKLCSYGGMVPSTYSSGGKTYHGRITKQGNRWIRWALVQSAHTAKRTDESLGAYYRKIKYRAGANAATMALARKLLEIVYKVWKEERPYYSKPVAVALTCL